MIGEEEIIPLINKFNKGDREAEKNLVAKTTKIIRGFLIKKQFNNSFIEDDINDVLIKVIENLSKFDPSKGEYSTWVCRIVKNHSIDQARKYSGNTVMNFSSFTTNYSHTETNQWDISETLTLTSSSNNNLNITDFTYTNSHGISFIDNGTYFNIDNINENDKQMIDMKYDYGYNYCEIGKEFNMTPNEVSNRVNYLKNKIKKKIKKGSN